MPPRLSKLSSLGRPLDPAWPTNRAVLVLVPLTGVVAAAWALLAQGAGGGGAALTGARWAAATFGGWALARELAPDDQPAAFLAMAMVALALLFEPTSGVWPLFVVLFLVRTVNRTVGPEPTWMDTVGVLAVAGAAALATGRWTPAAVAALAFACDTALPPPGPRRHGLAGLGALALAGWIALSGTGGGTGAADSLAARVVGWVAALPFLWRIARTTSVRSVSDIGNEALSAARIRAGMVVAFAWVAPALVGMEPGIEAALLTLATLAAVGLSGMRPARDRA
jgi:hypothetical protein